MPLLGSLSDKYGRKAILTLPMTLMIIPLGILAYSRTKTFFYVYYVFKIIINMICDGCIPCLALAYVADNVPESGRSTAFGILSGIGSSAFVCGTLAARFLSTAQTFQGKPTISCKSKSNMPLLKALRSLQDLTSFLNSSKIITQAAIVAFFSNLADVGFHGSMM
ncbi:MFS transporter, partial [Trifolium medium]|nr:MFS transporter [Trifolium medium]